MKKILFAAAIILSLVGCKSKNSGALLPNVSGKAGEVLVVLDKGNWEGSLGTVLRENLATDCPYLAQKEPLYSLVNIVPSTFTQMFQIHRNIIVFHIAGDVTTPGVQYWYNKWAKPQLVVYISAVDNASAEMLVNESMTKIIASFEQIERDRVVAGARQYSERELTPYVTDLTGGSMVFPSGYKLMKSTDNFLWISYVTTPLQQGVMIYKIPVDKAGSEPFTREAIVERRNAVLHDNVPGMFEGTYMTTSDALPLFLEYRKYKGRDFAELRGWWDVEGDFMGGPFVSHTFYSQDGEYLICAEAYVYAPKYDKRLYLRQVEALLYSFEWPELDKKNK